VAHGLDVNGNDVAAAACRSTGLSSLPAPDAATPDETIEVRCGTNDDPDDDAVATVRMLPLFAAPASSTSGPPRELLAADLVTHTAAATCTADGSDRLTVERSGAAQVECRRRDADTAVVVTVPWFVDVAVQSTTLALTGAPPALAVRIEQQAATSCAVTCAALSSTSEALQANGAVTVAVPAGIASGSCEVTCAGPADDGTMTTAPVTFSVHVGSATTLAELEQLADVDAVVGSIALTTEDLDDPLADDVTGLASLVVITGGLHLRDIGNGVVKYAFPALTHVGGSFVLDDNIGLQGLSEDRNVERPAAFPVLASIGGTLTISGNTALTTVSLPQLTSIGGALTITSNASLSEVTFPALASLGGALNVTSNPVLRTVALPSLASIGEALNVTGNGVLAAVTLAPRYSVGGGPAGDFTVAFNGADLTCAEIEALLRAIETCPAGANEIVVSAPSGTCDATCP
jgi:hypothetical protein